MSAIAVVASLSETAGARLNETVTDGNKPVWFKARGVVLAALFAIVNSAVLPLAVALLTEPL